MLQTTKSVTRCWSDARNRSASHSRMTVKRRELAPCLRCFLYPVCCACRTSPLHILTKLQPTTSHM
jgi:hypothetical protein